MKSIKNIVLYIIFIMIIILSPSAFAQDFSVASSIKSSTNGNNGSYLGTEIYYTGTQHTYSVNTRYSGRLSIVTFYLPINSNIFDWNYNRTYTITLNMATEDWRNKVSNILIYNTNLDGSIPSTASNLYVSNSYQFISMKKIKFQFKLGSTVGAYLKFTIASGSVGSTAITGDINWNLSSIIISDNYSSGGGSSGGGSSGGGSSGSTDSSNTDIINNANNNTQEIIDNQNSNTSSVIENNNANTQEIIDNNNKNFNHCIKNYLNVTSSTTTTGGVTFTINSDKSITINGTNSSGSTIFYSLGSSFTLEKGTYTLSNGNNNTTYNGFLFYDDNRNFTTTTASTKTFVNDVTIRPYIRIGSGVTINNQTIYPMIINNSSTISNYIQYGNEYCTNRIDETNSAINNVNNYLSDDSDPNVNNNEITSLFSNVGYSDPLNYLLQLPTMLINKVVSLSDTCQSINLGTLLGSPIIFPCINIGNIVGQSVWNTIDVICTVGLLVVIFKNLYQTFANLMTLGGEKQARETFNMPTPMEFLSYVLGGDK